MTNATFTSMDVSTKEEWLNIGAETAKNQPRVAEGILNMLRGMDTIVDGFVTDQLTHALQTATMAERAGADDECHFYKHGCVDQGRMVEHWRRDRQKPAACC